MRISGWACIVVVVLTGAVAYRHFDRPSLPTLSALPPGQLEWQPIEQEFEWPLAHKDDARVDEEQMADVATAPVVFEPDRLPEPLEAAPLEGVTASITTTMHAERNDTPQNLSYLAYYAYSELPPATKPADTVLDSLKDVPRGTPIEEIRRVSGVLGLDVTFMKTVAKVESGFDPKQRTGSYIGLFQLSKNEFEKFGSGEILDARDNAVAAALKFMSENIEFQMFTQRTPTLNDVYLIHQQGVEGAAEHLTHPRRLAWRSMCATDEGKQKGEKWCKRAIWGNITPAVKRVWKNVNKVTSGAFVAMWRQRVSEFYARYSEAAVN